MDRWAFSPAAFVIAGAAPAGALTGTRLASRVPQRQLGDRVVAALPRERRVGLLVVAAWLLAENAMAAGAPATSASKEVIIDDGTIAAAHSRRAVG